MENHPSQNQKRNSICFVYLSSAALYMLIFVFKKDALFNWKILNFNQTLKQPSLDFVDICCFLFVPK
jgi:hypothetical protein